MRQEYVEWSNSFSMGIKVIDDQHKKLLDIVNDLYNHSSDNPDEEGEYFKSVIGQAVEYIKTHFSEEEKFMKAIKFPDYDNHKKEHNSFVLNVIKSIKDFEDGKRLVLVNFASFLKEWILAHIAIEDNKYAVYFKQLATRKEDGTLSITAEDIEKIMKT